MARSEYSNHYTGRPETTRSLDSDTPLNINPRLVLSIAAVMLLIGLAIIAQYNFLLFHVLAELFSVAVAWGVFLLVWNSRSIMTNRSMVFLGVAYLAVGLTDIIHTLCYKGMGVFPDEYASNHATQLWLSARSIEFTSLLVFAAYQGRRFPLRLMAASVCVVTSLSYFAIFAWQIFPTCFVEGVGLTAFKKTAEYVLCVIIFLSIGLLIHKREYMDRLMLRLIIGSMIASALAELAFTFYVSVYGLSNLAGHFLKIASFMMIYMALIQSGLTRPYTTLFKELSESKERWRNLAEAMPQLVWTCEPDGSCDYLSQQWVNYTGIEEQQQLGDGWLKQLYPDDRDDVRAQWRDAVEKEHIFETEYRIRRHDGEYRWFLTRAVPVRDSDGAVVKWYGSNSDIEDLKRAEAEILHNEHYYRSLIHSLHEDILVIDRDYRISDINNKALQTLGRRREDVIGRYCYEVSHNLNMPCNAAEQECGLQRVLTTKQSCSMHHTHVSASGHTTHVDLMMSPLKDSDGNITHVIEAARDVTDLFQMQEALAESQAMLQAAMDNCQAGIVIADAPDGRLRYANNAAQILRGARESERHGEVALEPNMFGYQMLHLNGKPYSKEEVPLTRAIAHGETCCAEFIVRRPDEGDLIVWATAAPIRNAKEEIIAGIVAFLDVTERKRTEEEVRNLRNYLANIINSMPSILIGVDENGFVTQWNRESERATGRSAKDAIGLPLSDAFPRLSSATEFVKAAIRTGKPYSASKLARQEEDGTHYDELTIYPLEGNIAAGAVIRVDDETNRVRIEEMMIQSEKMLSVGGLAAGMAHELNNPLGGILQSIQNIERRVSPDLPANRQTAEDCGTNVEAVRDYLNQRNILEFIEGIRECGSRAAFIVHNMLQFSRKSNAQISRTDVAELIDRAVQLAEQDYDLRKQFDFRHIEIVREYDENLPDIMVVETEIEQVLLNLLKNGAHAMQDNPPERSPQFVLRAHSDRNMVTIEVEDNGHGMSDEVRRRVFEPFFTTKEVGTGTGLGLAVAYMIIRQNHSGELTVDSAPGAGTTFTIHLPREGRQPLDAHRERAMMAGTAI